MIPANKTVEIYYLVDEFLKEYDSVIKSHSLEERAPKKRRNRKFTMSRVARSWRFLSSSIPPLFET